MMEKYLLLHNFDNQIVFQRSEMTSQGVRNMVPYNFLDDRYNSFYDQYNFWDDV